MAYSPDGRRIISGSSDKTIRVWDAETGKAVDNPFEGHTDFISNVTYAPDGRRVFFFPEIGQSASATLWETPPLSLLAFIITQLGGCIIQMGCSCFGFRKTIEMD
ncbi:POC1 centriolar protein A [Serendipita sp. 411]|nr:POC1 centriolar protein A [Serendipita sp. 411]KAG9034458.1 POC1 centriolar protein A [Serendipita sp. 407]